MNQNIDLYYHFDGVQKHVEESIKQYVQENVTNKMDAYFKKVINHNDAHIGIRINIAKHKNDERYDGSFLYTLDGKDYSPYIREGDKGFENVHDLVNHAFDHLKEQLAAQKEKRNVKMVA